jgi:AcrR family transcriptional regulator
MMSTRASIDDAALGLFARLGYHAATMRMIAAEAGVQPAAIYHWYESKEALLFRLQIDFMDQLEARVLTAVDARPTPALKLAAAVREHVHYHGRHTRAAFVTDSEIRALGEDRRRELIARRDSYQALWSGWIRDGVRDGSLRSSDSQVATRAILLQCTGVGLWFHSSGPLPLDDICEIHVELVLASLQASRELIDEAIAGLRAIPAGLPGDVLEAAA